MIVFVDDHDDIRFAVHRILQRAGHRVVLAADGAAGWLAVRRHRPRLVLTDVDMPRMTGLELCRAIRADADLRHIPVVLTTGSLLDDEQVTAAGASALLTKPFHPAQLLACLAPFLAPDAQYPATADRQPVTAAGRWAGGGADQRQVS